MRIRDPLLLDRVRVARDLTRSALADLVSTGDGKPVSRQVVDRWCRVHGASIPEAEASRLAEVLDVDVDLLCMPSGHHVGRIPAPAVHINT
jgi:hypothetical protein